MNTQPSSRKKRKMTINKIRNGKEVTMDIIETQRIRDQYKQLYTNKVGDLEEIEKFLEKYSLPRLNWKEIEKMNGPITSTKI